MTREEQTALKVYTGLLLLAATHSNSLSCNTPCQFVHICALLCIKRHLGVLGVMMSLETSKNTQNSDHIL